MDIMLCVCTLAAKRHHREVFWNIQRLETPDHLPIVLSACRCLSFILIHCYWFGNLPFLSLSLFFEMSEQNERLMGSFAHWQTLSWTGSCRHERKTHTSIKIKQQNNALIFPAQTFQTRCWGKADLHRCVQETLFPHEIELPAWLPPHPHPHPPDYSLPPSLTAAGRRSSVPFVRNLNSGGRGKVGLGW